MSASRFSISVSRGVVGLCAVSALAIGCSKGTSVNKDDLALVPKETEIAVGLNVARVRGTAMWKKLMDFVASDEKSKKELDEFNKTCVDLNSTDGVDSILVALPEPNQTAKDAAAILRLKSAIDEAKLTKCFEYLAGKNNEKVTSTTYNGKKIYSSTKDPADKGGFVQLDGKTIGFGSATWVKKVIDLAAGKDPASAKTNDKLVALVKRAKTSDALWAVGTVPPSVRDSFKNQPQLAPLSSLKAVFGSVDFASGLTVDANLETGSEADAKAINEQVTTQLVEAKKSPQVMMLGVGAWLDGVKNEAKGPVFRVGMNYNQAQVDEMIARIQGLLKSFGAGLAGPGGPAGLGGPAGPGLGRPAPGQAMPPGPPPGMQLAPPTP